MKLELFFPAKPYTITQPYGVYRPDVYKRFGFTRHNGVDFRLGADKLVYAEFPCVVHRTTWQPEGGGLVLSVVSDKEYEFEDGVKAYITADYMHLEKYLVGVSDLVLPTGAPLAVADNTGFSTGPHTHAQYRRVHKKRSRLVDVDKNDANNSFDPEPYRNRKFAKDERDIKIALLQKAISLLEALIKTLKK